VKVLDLGLARQQKQQNGVTQQLDGNAVLGTIDFMAPEQALGAKNIDIRADIYSLGGTFYYLLTGEMPYGTGSTAQKLLSHQISEPVPIEQFRTDLPKQVIKLISTMMKKNPDERPSQPAEVTQALQRWASPITQADVNVMPVYSARVQKLLNHPVPNPPSTVTTYAALTQSNSGKLNASGVRSTVLQQAPPSHVQYVLKAGTAKTKKLQPLSEVVKRPVSKKLVAGVALATMLLCSILYFVLAGSSTSSLKQQNVSILRLPLQVSKRLTSGNSQQVFKSVAEALRIARQGDLITIMDDVWMEQVNETGLQLRQVTITSGTDKPIKWLPPVQHNADQPLLSLRDPQGLTIRNIQFDGEKRVASVLCFEGDTSNVECTKLHLKNTTRAAVQLISVQSSFGQAPCKFDQCVFQTDEPGLVSAISIEQNNTRKECRDIKLTGNIFTGQYKDVLGTQTSLDALEFTNNRVFSAETLIRFGAESNLFFKNIQVRNNNIHTMQHLVSLAKMPANSDRLVIKYNLFISVRGMLTFLQAEENLPDSLPWLQVLGNYGDATSLTDYKSRSNASTVVDIPRVKTENPMEEEFLRLPRSSSLNTLRTSDGNTIGITQQ
jgi:serine/threonine protein kinase